ncbi:MAG TPA: hypothetical protein VE152_08190 [Acidimicrobiales bacterium]|nr:hypothetical protein [Acidimicrobiales bacterium]
MTQLVGLWVGVVVLAVVASVVVVGLAILLAPEGRRPHPGRPGGGRRPLAPGPAPPVDAARRGP